MSRALIISVGLLLAAAGCSGERPSDHSLGESGEEPQVTVTTASTVARTTSTTSTAPTTSTQPEAQPDTTAPTVEAAGEGEGQLPVTSVESGSVGREDLEHLAVEVDLSPPARQATVVDMEPVEDMLVPGPERPEVNIRFEPGAVRATESGTIDFRERQTYRLYASEGQPFTATLKAPLGVWLDIRLDYLVVTSAAQRSQIAEAVLPATGPWKVTVISSHAGESDYELTVEVLPRAAVAPSPTTTTQPVTVPRPVTPDDDGDVVYLTFDDGPNPEYTPQMLDVLARYDARATFFVVGRLAQAYPDIIQRIAAEGHTIANHTWRHEDLAGLSREAFDETISRTQAVLGDLAAPCLRPPYGSMDAYTREWAASHGLTLLTWDASPADWLRPPAEEIADYIVKWARPGIVMLLHDGGGDRSRTVQGVDMALERLADRGLRYEPVCR